MIFLTCALRPTFNAINLRYTYPWWVVSSMRGYTKCQILLKKKKKKKISGYANTKRLRMAAKQGKGQNVENHFIESQKKNIQSLKVD